MDTFCKGLLIPGENKIVVYNLPVGAVSSDKCPVHVQESLNMYQVKKQSTQP